VRGTKGGYELAFPPEQLTVGRVAEALEGPLRLTECMQAQEGGHEPTNGHEACNVFGSCLIKRSLFLVHTKIRDALYGVTIADLARNAGPVRHAPSSGRLPLVSGGATET
jgi:DNA-binding IscR family transcriptional regulator